MRDVLAFLLYLGAACLIGYIVAVAIDCWVRRDERR